MIPITGIISAIQAGVPALERITRLFKKKQKTNVSTLSMEQLQSKVSELETAHDEHPIEWAVKTLITLATVYGVVWTAKHFGVTSEQILSLMGLIK